MTLIKLNCGYCLAIAARQYPPLSAANISPKESGGRWTVSALRAHFS